MFFRGDFNGTPPQRRSSKFTFTHTHTHTHTHDWPTVADRSSGSRFFRVLQIFWTTCGQQEFFRPPGGHATYENIILRELIVSFCLYFYAGIMLQGFVIRI